MVFIGSILSNSTRKLAAASRLRIATVGDRVINIRLFVFSSGKSSIVCTQGKGTSPDPYEPTSDGSGRPVFPGVECQFLQSWLPAHVIAEESP